MFLVLLGTFVAGSVTGILIWGRDEINVTVQNTSTSDGQETVPDDVPVEPAEQPDEL